MPDSEAGQSGGKRTHVMGTDAWQFKGQYCFTLVKMRVITAHELTRVPPPPPYDLLTPRVTERATDRIDI